MNRKEGNPRSLAAWARRLGAIAAIAGLAGCAVGPNFARPAPPSVAGYTPTPVPNVIPVVAGEPAQHFHAGQALSRRWWRLFGSSRLDGVIAQAIADSRTLAAARATLAQAQEIVAAARGAYFPHLELSATAQRNRSATGNASFGFGGISPISNLYSVGADVSFSPDVFGLTRRTVEEQGALAQFQHYELAAAYLALTGNTAAEAITIASLRAQIEATEALIADDERNLSLVEQEFAAGKVARTDVLTAQTQLAADRTAIPPLRQQLSAARHALSVLAGRAPALWSPPDFELAQFTLPSDLPVTLPSKLVRQRPDILAAEAQLHAASAAIGIATAQLYPNLTLSGSIGQQSLQWASFLNTANRFWNLTAGLTAPIFEGGTLEAQRRAAVDAYHASLATYEQTVLASFQQVADNLRALAHDAQLLGAERQAYDTAGAALTLQRESYAAGKSTVLNLIDAERSYQQARLGYVRAQAQRLQDSASLFVALGGGWWQAKL
ncbi:MAG: efflux transporter outer membrane subunit [Betaproteobacteria bacterium]|nr:efflux transporter outer membrane subunit [Betaproteobacteria bacterium]